MKKIIAVSLALIMTLALMAVPVFADSPALETRYQDGVSFVWLREVAEAMDAQVRWDGPNQTVHFTTACGVALAIVFAEVGGFNDRGTVWVPLDFAMTLFDLCLCAPEYVEEEVPEPDYEEENQDEDYEDNDEDAENDEDEDAEDNDYDNDADEDDDNGLAGWTTYQSGVITVLIPNADYQAESFDNPDYQYVTFITMRSDSDSAIVLFFRTEGFDDYSPPEYMYEEAFELLQAVADDLSGDATFGQGTLQGFAYQSATGITDDGESQFELRIFVIGDELYFVGILVDYGNTDLIVQFFNNVVISA